MKEKLELFIKDNLIEYTQPKQSVFKKIKAALYEEQDIDFECACAPNIDDYIEDNKDENKFQKLLFKLIDDRGLKDSDVYNKVNVDRRLFSKIRSNEDYHPSKETIILLAISLELSLDELLQLLESASYSLPKNNKYDLIIRFCFLEHIYNIDTINEFLYDYGFNTL